MFRSLPFLAVAAGCLVAGCRLERPGFADSIAQRQAEQAHTGPACGVSDSTRLSGEGIGALRLGMTADTIGRACGILEDSQLSGAGGQRTRELRVDLIRDTVIAEMVHDSLAGLRVSGPGFRTREGYGVGSTLEQLMHWSDLTSATADGSLFVMSPSHCGMNFRLAGPAPVPPSPQSGVKALKHTPGEVRVSEVRIVGCRNASGAAPAF